MIYAASEAQAGAHKISRLSGERPACPVWVHNFSDEIEDLNIFPVDQYEKAKREQNFVETSKSITSISSECCTNGTCLPSKK